MFPRLTCSFILIWNSDYIERLLKISLDLILKKNSYVYYSYKITFLKSMNIIKRPFHCLHEQVKGFNKIVQYQQQQ